MWRSSFLFRCLTPVCFAALALAAGATPTMQWMYNGQTLTNPPMQKSPSGAGYSVGGVMLDPTPDYTYTVTITKDGAFFTGRTFSGGSVVPIPPVNTSDTGNKRAIFVMTVTGGDTGVPSSSMVVKTFMPDTVPPSTPGSLQVTSVQTNQITVQWNASTDSPAAGVMSHYQFTLNGTTSGTVVAGSPPTPNTQPASYTYTLTGLIPGTNYVIGLKAVDWADNESAAANVNATTLVLDTTIPSQPGAISYPTLTSNSATAAWAASTDNVGVTGYDVKLYAGATANGTPLVAQTVVVPTYNFTNLSILTQYTVSVVARDAAGNSSTIRTGTFTTAPVTVPNNLAATGVSYNRFGVTWSPVVDGTEVSFYEVEINGSVYSAGVEFGSPKLYYYVTGLSASTLYTVRVRSVVSASYQSAWSDPLTVTTSTPLVALPASVTRPAGSGPIVGAAGASLSVDNKGSANYSIPLQIAPGRSGLQPSLALGYSSGAGNGPLGLGWSLSTGFPQSISRGRSILARDGEVRGVSFDDTNPDSTKRDKFYLDGKRLICVSGEQGAPGSTYRTEVDSFVTVSAAGTGTTIESFVVTDKSGVKMTFGKTAGEVDGYQRGVGGPNDRAYTYALKRVEDTLGNYVAFTYLDKGGGEYVLGQIDYTGGSSISPEARVEFEYEARTDQPLTWMAQRSFMHRARLAVVYSKSKVAGSYITTAAYGLNYDAAPAGGRSRLTSVAPVLADPATQALVSVQPTVITWQDFEDSVVSGGNAGGVDSPATWGDTDGDGDDDVAQSSLPSGGPYSSVQFVDIDGDGRKDKAATVVTILAYDGTVASITCNVQLAKDSSYVSVPVSLTDPDTGPGTGGGTRLLGAEGGAAASRITFADFTGDGRDDVLVHGFDGRIRVYPSLGNSFGPASSLAAASPDMGGAGNITWEATANFQSINIWIERHFFIKPMPCDLNGDGRMDYVCTSYNRLVNYPSTQPYILPFSYFSSRTVLGVLSKPDGTFSAPFSVNTFMPTTTNGGNGVPYGAFRVDDLNSGVFPGDFNGDGMTDFLCLDNKNIEGKRWLLLISKGENANGQVSFEWHPGVVPNTVALPNGDTVKTHFTPIVTDGLGYVTNPQAQFFPTNPSIGQQAFSAIEGGAGANNTTVMDVNHDGLPDLVWYAANKADATESPATAPGWWAMLATGNYQPIGSGSPVAFTGPVSVPALNSIGGGSAYNSSNGLVTTSLNHGIDVDGDGHVDYFAETVTNGKPGGGTIYLARAPDGPDAGSLPDEAHFGDLVFAVTDGLGRRTDVAYKAAKDDAVYTPGAAVSYPIRDMRASNPVVSDVWHDSGTGVATDRAQFSYQYSGNRLDLSGRGSLGFHSFVTLDRQTNLFKYQFLAQSFPMTGLTHREETYRWWLDGGQDKFRFISSHDNTVVFDKVSTSGGTTLWPFIAKAVESRWEDASTAHFAFPSAPVNSQPENLFPQAKPAGAHITITAQSTFDNQSAPQLTLPGVTGYNPSDTNSAGANTVVGTTTYATFSGLPGNISHGNLKQLATDFGGGFTETVTTTYQAPVGPLTGLVDTVTTSVVSPVGGSEVASVKRYTYSVVNSVQTPLVATEKIDSPDDKLDLTTTYTRDTRGRVTATDITGYNNAGPEGATVVGSLTEANIQHIGTYQASSVTAFNDTFDLPTTTKNAAPYSHQTVTQYHSFLAKPVSVTDVNGAQLTTTYDALGRAISTTDVLKNLTSTTTFAWTTSTDTDWKKTQTVAVPSGIIGLPGVTLSSAYAVRTAATVAPAATAYYDRLGRVIRTIKDGFNGQQTVTDAVYNKLGQTVATSLPYLASDTPQILWTKSTYDPLGRVVTVTAPNLTVTANTYKGRITQVSVDAPDIDGVNPPAQINSTLVDAKGRTVKVWNNDNQPALTLLSGSDAAYTSSTPASIAFALDGFGRMRTTTLKGQTQTITATYDGFGRQTSLSDPDKGNWTYVNNALGQVVKQSDATGNITRSTFDRLGRPLTRQTLGVDSSTELANFYYYDTDATKPHTVAKGTKGWIGAPEREEADTTGAPGFNAPQTVNLHYYDAKGRPSIEMAQTDGKWFYTYSDYDAYSRVAQVRHYWKPSGAEAPDTQPYVWQDFGYTYQYDGTGATSKSYLTALTDSLGRSWWDSPVYDHLDRVTSVRKGNGLTTTRAYRPDDGVLTAINTGSSQIQNLNFNFDGLGNLTQRTDANATGGTEDLTYDILNRLKTSKQGTMVYAANGNITSKPDVAGATVTITAYDTARPHAVSSYTFNSQTTNITYDANGNLLTRQNTTTGETWSMKWAGFDKPRWMAKTEVGTSGPLVRGSEFHYNAGRSRVLQLEFDTMAGGAPEHYNRKRTYALGATLELNYKNTVATGTGQSWALDKVRIYVPGPDGIIGAREFEPSALVGGVPSPRETALVYHYDHLGSITAITDYGTTTVATATGNKAGKFSEDAWGQRRNPLTWSGAPTTATDDGGADSLTPRGYTGHEMLDDLGLVHMNGRIYDPLLGRFLSADVVVQAPGNLQSYNRYSYVMNNPLTLTDPSGFNWIDDLKQGVEDLKKFIGNIFISDTTKERFTGVAADGDGEDKLFKASAAQGVEKGIKVLEAAAGATNTLVKSTPILGQVVTGANALTGKNVLDPTGRTTVSRASEGGELVTGMVVGAVANKLAPVISRVGGKIATALKGEVDTLVAPAAKDAADEVVTVYRGVHAEHPALPEALQGRAAPIGGHADPALHNAFDNRSIFTSWTTDKATAVEFATGNGPGGVLLKDSVPRSTLTVSPDVFKEFEVLRTGAVEGATPIILSK